MATINDFYPTDDVDDVLDDWIRELIPSTLRSEYKNSETLSATRTLLDADTPYQRFDCNGASRIAKVPTGDAVNNHPFIVVNSTSSGTHVLNIQNNAGSVTLIGLNPSEWAFLVPDGNGGYFVANKPFSVVLSPSQITSNQDNYNPSGAGSADVLRISSDAARNVTGLAFPAANKTILLTNVGSFTITLKNNVTSTAANRFLIGADFELGADQAVMLYYDATSSRWRMVGGGGGGGSGLTVSSAAVTTSNVTGVAGTRHVLDVSGMTANRNFVLPAGAVDDEIEVNLSVGDATYALILIGDTGISINNGSTATEWSRIFIKGETVRFVATSATNWQVIVDGRVACSAEIQNSGAQAIANNTDTKATLDELVNDNCSITDTTNSRITIRRSGHYIVTLHMRFDTYGGNGVADGYMYEDLTTIKVLDEKYSISGRRPTVLITSKLYLEAGKAEYFYLYQNSGGSVNTYVASGQKTLFSIYELLS